jgi:hypothetical protein
MVDGRAGHAETLSRQVCRAGRNQKRINPMSVMLRFAMCVLLMIGPVADASAQESGGAVYVKGGVSFPYQPSLRSQAPPPFGAPAGGTVSWLFGGGVFLFRAISVEFDVSHTGVMTSSQLGRHNTGESGWRQDRFASFGVKGHVPAGAWLRVEPAAGLVLIRTREASSSSLSVDQRPTWSPDRSHVGLMVGADLRMGRHHVAFLPGVRVYLSGTPDGTRWDFNYPEWTIRPSLAIAAGF